MQDAKANADAMGNRVLATDDYCLRSVIFKGIVRVHRSMKFLEVRHKRQIVRKAFGVRTEFESRWSSSVETAPIS
jgi:hypothetical protein